MRPLVTLLGRCVLLFLCACQARPGPSSALDLRPELPARRFARPDDGVDSLARVGFCRLGLRRARRPLARKQGASHDHEMAEGLPAPHHRPFRGTATGALPCRRSRRRGSSPHRRASALRTELTFRPLRPSPEERDGGLSRQGMESLLTTTDMWWNLVSGKALGTPRAAFRGPQHVRAFLQFAPYRLGPRPVSNDTAAAWVCLAGHGAGARSGARAPGPAGWPRSSIRVSAPSRAWPGRRNSQGEQVSHRTMGKAKLPSRSRDRRALKCADDPAARPVRDLGSSCHRN
jgi:hypothetical protein